MPCGVKIEGAVTGLEPRQGQLNRALHLPQAAARLRSQPRLPASSTGRGRRVSLLRLADFCGAGRRPLAKTGALRQRRLPVSSTGCGRRVSLLRLADFCGGRRSALVKIGALLRVAVDQICSAGRRPLAYLDGCPCSASPVSAAGSGSATQPTTAPCFVHWMRSPPLPLLTFLQKSKRYFVPPQRRCCSRRTRAAETTRARASLTGWATKMPLMPQARGNR